MSTARTTLSFVALGALLLACSRHADVRVDGSAPPSVLGPGLLPTEPDDMPTVDSGLESDAYGRCSDRTNLVACTGPDDIPCEPQIVMEAITSSCLYYSGCTANGWMRATMGPDGCVASIEMEEPDTSFVACLVEHFSRLRCPCNGQQVNVFLGIGHDGDAGVVCQQPKE